MALLRVHVSLREAGARGGAVQRVAAVVIRLLTEVRCACACGPARATEYLDIYVYFNIPILYYLNAEVMKINLLFYLLNLLFYLWHGMCLCSSHKPV